MKLHRYVDDLRLHIRVKGSFYICSSSSVINSWYIWKIDCDIWFLYEMKYIWMEFSCIRRLRSFWPRIASLAIPYLELSTLDVAENGVLADSSFTFWAMPSKKASSNIIMHRFRFILHISKVLCGLIWAFAVHIINPNTFSHGRPIYGIGLKLHRYSAEKCYILVARSSRVSCSVCNALIVYPHGCRQF